MVGPEDKDSKRCIHGLPKDCCFFCIQTSANEKDHNEKNSPDGNGNSVSESA